MAREDRKPELGFLDEESLGFLLGEEIRSFHTYGFEGSKEEHQIFTEIFYGKNACSAAKSCTYVGMINHASDQNSQSRAVVSLNSKSPALTCQPSLKTLHSGVCMEKCKEINVDVSRSCHLQENHGGHLEFVVCNRNSKRSPFLSVGLPNFQRKGQDNCWPDINNDLLLLKSSENDSRTDGLDLNHMPHPTPYRIVESFSQGIISTCYFLTHCDERDEPNDIDDNTPSRGKGSDDLIGDMKLDDEVKATTALVSWESSAPKLRIADKPNTSTVSKESNFFDSDANESSMAFVRELPKRLRLHAHNLLLDAGWMIGTRRRKDRPKLYSVFRTPGEGLVIYSLIKAWRMCGKWLIASDINSSQEENSRQWLQIDEFWHDLADALAYIEKKVRHPQSTLSLLHKWYLLDPFVSVVCIDKKVSALREGKAVKFVKGRSIELHLNTNLSSTEKAGLNFENQTAKFTPHLVNRPNHCLPPGKPSNICTSVSSPLNHAIVDESVLTALKPEVIETSYKKKLDCKYFSEFPMLVHHDSKGKYGSGRLHRKLSFGGDVKKRSLKSLSRSIGNGSIFNRRLHHMKRMVSMDCSKQKNTSLGMPCLIRKLSALSDSTSEPNVPLSSQPELSAQDLKLVGAASTNKPTNHKVKKDVGASELCRDFPLENQQYEEAASSQQTSNLFLKEDTASYGRNKKCSKRMFAYGKTYDACDKLREAERLERHGSSVFDGSSNGVVLSLASDAEITAKDHSGYEEYDAALRGGLNEKMLISAVALGNGASFSLENQVSRGEGKKVQPLYTQQPVSGNQRDVVSDVIMYLGKHSSVYQQGSVSGFLFGADSRNTQSSGFAAQQPLWKEVPNLAGKKFEEDILVNPKRLKRKHADAHESSKSGPELISAAVAVNRKANKRSRKISQVAAIKLQHKGMEATPPSEKYGGKIDLDMDEKMSDDLDLPLCQGVDNTLEVGRPSWTSMTSENHKMPNQSAIKMSGTPETSFAVSQTCMAVEKHINHETPRSRSVKVNRKFKERNKQQVKSESGSLNIDKDQEGRGECQDDDNKRQKQRVIFSQPTSGSSLQRVKTKKFPTIGSKSKTPVGVASQNKSLVRLQSENCTTQESFLSESKFSESQTMKRTAKRNNSEPQKESCWKRQRGDDIEDDDLLIAVIIKTKDLSSNSTHSSCNPKRSQSKGCRMLKSRKGSCKLLLRTPGKSGTHSISGARTPLAWLLNCRILSLNASVQYRSPKNNTILKDGRVTREGILCKCCSKTLSVSAFKCHAGCKSNHSSLNLFLDSSKSYTLCQLQAWSDEYRARKDGRQVAEVEEVDQNDDTCGLCGDGGELICCDNCPSTFHQACLHSQVIPVGSWYCPNCTCKICGDAVVAEMPLGSFIMLECSQCEQKYHDMCLKRKGSSNCRSVSDTWFCEGYCEKVYFGLRSRIGVMNAIADGFSWTVLRCNHSDQKVQSAPKIAMMAECNSKLAVALTIMEECFLPMIDPRTGINLIPQVLYNWGSNFPRLNYHGFHTIILEKDDKIISVATLRVHGVSVAEMPLIATCSEHRRQGMCRRLMGAIEEMLKSFKVEMLVLSAIPDLIDTWTSGFGFKPISDDEKRRLSTINLMLFPGTALLKKSLCEAFEMRKPEDEKISPLKEDLRHVDFCGTRTEPMTLQQPYQNSFPAGIDLIVGRTPQICTNLLVYEQENCAHQSLPASSSAITLTIVAGCERDDVTNAVSCNEDSNILGSELMFTDPRPSAIFREPGDVEGARSGNIGITAEQKVMDGAHLPGGDKTGDVKITETPEGKNCCNILETADSLNPINLCVAGTNDATASIDVPIQCKERQSSSIIRRGPAVEIHNTMDVGVDSKNGKEDRNSSTLACINGVSDPSEPDLESTKEALDPVIIPVSVTNYSRVRHMFPEENFQEKNADICLSVMSENIGKRGPYYTYCNGIYENVQDRETLKMKTGILPQRGAVVNNVKTVNLSQKTVSNCSEMALEEVEKSLRDLSLCLQEEYSEDQQRREGICDLV